MRFVVSSSVRVEDQAFVRFALFSTFFQEWLSGIELANEIVRNS